MECNRIFRLDEHQELFEKQGFVQINLLNNKAIKKLNVIFDKLHKKTNNDGFVSGGYSCDLEYKKQSSELISEITQPFLEKYLINYKIYGSTFVYKTPTKNSELGPHQDWTIVDEEKYVSANCWIPLHDINRRCGPLYVMPGSHYANHKVIRSPNMGYYYDNYKRTVLKYLVPMLVKSGTAVILNHSIIHYSSVNRSSSIRRALITALKSKNAETILYYLNSGNNKLEKYAVNENFAIEYNDFFNENKLVPKGKLLNSTDYKQLNYSKREIEEHFIHLVNSSGYFKRNIDMEINKIRNIVSLW